MVLSQAYFFLVIRDSRPNVTGYNFQIQNISPCDEFIEPKKIFLYTQLYSFYITYMSVSKTLRAVHFYLFH